MKRVASWICQLAFLGAATLAFIVLYEHGPSDFLRHARAEFVDLANWGKGGRAENFPASK